MARTTERDLAIYVEYLKAENRIHPLADFLTSWRTRGYGVRRIITFDVVVHLDGRLGTGLHLRCFRVGLADIRWLVVSSPMNSAGI